MTTIPATFMRLDLTAEVGSLLMEKLKKALNEAAIFTRKGYDKRVQETMKPNKQMDHVMRTFLFGTEEELENLKKCKGTEAKKVDLVELWKKFKGESREAEEEAKLFEANCVKWKEFLKGASIETFCDKLIFIFKFKEMDSLKSKLTKHIEGEEVQLALGDFRMRVEEFASEDSEVNNKISPEIVANGASVTSDGEEKVCMETPNCFSFSGSKDFHNALVKPDFNLHQDLAKEESSIYIPRTIVLNPSTRARESEKGGETETDETETDETESDDETETDETESDDETETDETESDDETETDETESDDETEGENMSEENFFQSLIAVDKPQPKYISFSAEPGMGKSTFLTRMHQHLNDCKS